VLFVDDYEIIEAEKHFRQAHDSNSVRDHIHLRLTTHSLNRVVKLPSTSFVRLKVQFLHRLNSIRLFRQSDFNFLFNLFTLLIWNF